MWGIRTYVPDAIGYSVFSERFYIFEPVEEVFGYFPHYTVEELFEAGKELISSDK